MRAIASPAARLAVVKGPRVAEGSGGPHKRAPPDWMKRPRHQPGRRRASAQSVSYPTSDVPTASWPSLARVAAAMMVAVGVGRFAYTPVLPLMRASAGLSAAGGTAIATVNYAGYLAGAVAGITRPAISRSVGAFRTSVVVVVLTDVAMAATNDTRAWAGLRLLSGIASAVVFVVSVTYMLDEFSVARRHWINWAFGGVGLGVALSGVAVRIAGNDWRAGWVLCGVVALAGSALAWPLRVSRPVHVAEMRPISRVGGVVRRRAFHLLVGCYLLEGVGYIVAGTFLVVAVDETASSDVGTSSWIIVGTAALPAAAIWGRLAQRYSARYVLAMALAIQAGGVTIPSLLGGGTPALISATLFGATFLGVASVAIQIGDTLNVDRSVAKLTAGYAIGQVLGPALVLVSGRRTYRFALGEGACVIAIALGVAVSMCLTAWPPRLSTADYASKP
jgi:hypothetical protein